MAPTQQKFREIVFQLLYCNDFDVSQDEDVGAFMMGEFALSNRSMRLAQERRDQIAVRFHEIDQKIAESSTGYAFDRIPRVERNVLRLGIFELLYDAAIPAKVAIAESIRLARKFASPEGGAFVNAVLDTLYKQRGALLTDAAEKEAPDAAVCDECIDKEPQRGEPDAQLASVSEGEASL